MKKVFIQVPATSANCGPGFDTLGLACNLYNEVSYEITDRKGFQLEVEGEGADYLKPFGRNLAFASFLRVWNAVTDGQRIGLKVKMHRLRLRRLPRAVHQGTHHAGGLSQAGQRGLCRKADGDHPGKRH